MSKLLGKKKAPIYENLKEDMPAAIIPVKQSEAMLKKIIENCASLALYNREDVSFSNDQLYWARGESRAPYYKNALDRFLEEYSKARHMSEFYWKEKSLIVDLKRKHFSQQDQELRENQEELLNNYFGEILSNHNQLRENFKKFKPQENQ